jgi:hypothetical protein
MVALMARTVIADAGGHGGRRCDQSRGRRGFTGCVASAPATGLITRYAAFAAFASVVAL